MSWKRSFLLDPTFAEAFLQVPLLSQDWWKVQGTVEFLLKEGWSEADLRKIYDEARKLGPAPSYDELMSRDIPSPYLNKPNPYKPTKPS